MPKSSSVSKGMTYTKDEFGKEILLKDGNLQVMMEWERPYMDACIETLHPKGDVLEIGFGLGYSATAIQKFKPKSHTIIECDPVVIEKAQEWAKKHPNVKIVQGMWQDVLQQLGKFDSIFFDDYSPLSTDDIKQITSDAQQGTTLAKEVDNLKNKLTASLKHFENVKFNDADLQTFGQQLLNRPNTQPKDVIDFIHALAKNGNITEKQGEAFLKTVKKQSKKPASQSSSDALVQWANQKEMMGDRLVTFIEACLEHHMNKGARLSSYLASADSKLLHKEFKEKILSRKDVEFTEKSIPIKVPPNCNYFHGDKAIVMVIEKK